MGFASLHLRKLWINLDTLCNQIVQTRYSFYSYDIADNLKKIKYDICLKYLALFA